MDLGRTSTARGISPAPAAAIGKVDAIEGLRAWLALTVVGYHLLNVTDMDAFYGFTKRADMFGEGAVHVFILISGFVIANLLMQKSEPWLPYITRRAFRLFPAYWLALGLGGIAMFLRLDAFQFMTWADHAPFVSDMANHKANADAVMQQPVEQILIHLGLFQSAVPPALSPNEIQSILGPAWSLSLEWQFYLVAPVLVWMLRRTAWALVLIAGTLLTMEILQRAIVFDWVAWAALPRYLHLFVIGILSRIALPRLRHLGGGYAWIAALVVAGFGLESGAAAPIVVWLSFTLLLSRQPPATPVERKLDGVFGLVFESRVAAWLGARSYSIYILHSPIIAITAWAVLRFHPFTRIEAFVLLGCIAIPLTILAADLMYRFVERPMIEKGRRLASQMQKGAAGAVPTAPAV